MDINIQERIENARNEIMQKTEMFLDKDDPIMLVLALSELMLINQEVIIKNCIADFHRSAETQLANVDSSISNFTETIDAFDESFKKNMNTKLVNKINSETNDFLSKSMTQILENVQSSINTNTEESTNKEAIKIDSTSIDNDIKRIKELVSTLSIISSLALASSLAVIVWLVI